VYSFDNTSYNKVLVDSIPYKNMKVLQVITSLYTGGAEKLLVDSIPLYRSKGIDMELLLLNGTKTPFFKTLEEQNIPIYALNQGNIKTIYNPLLIFRIIPYLKKYDIVHVHLFPTLYWVAIAKLFSFSKVKLLYTEHSTNNKRRQKTIGRIFDRFIYARYKFIVSISNGVDVNIKSHLSFNEGKFRIITNGINLFPFIHSKIETSSIKKTIIQVSSFQYPKDQATLIRSVSYLPENVRIVLVGDGENRPKCENLVKELNLENRVSFLGVRMDVPQLLKSADIVVLSSHYEGLSLSSMEAMASGKPFIASDVPGLREIVAGAGLLFPAGDEKILAERINALLSDSDYYKKVAKACCERLKEYDINKMVDQYIGLYKAI
jgi:glycosyltransferase involved in cell wall biosynthesis